MSDNAEMGYGHVGLRTGLTKGEEKWVGEDTIEMNNKEEKLTNRGHRDQGR